MVRTTNTENKNKNWKKLVLPLSKQYIRYTSCVLTFVLCDNKLIISCGLLVKQIKQSEDITSDFVITLCYFSLLSQQKRTQIQNAIRKPAEEINAGCSTNFSEVGPNVIKTGKQADNSC